MFVIGWYIYYLDYKIEKQMPVSLIQCLEVLFECGMSSDRIYKLFERGFYNS